MYLTIVQWSDSSRKVTGRTRRYSKVRSFEANLRHICNLQRDISSGVLLSSWKVANWTNVPSSRHVIFSFAVAVFARS